jgi:hypothetical protein
MDNTNLPIPKPTAETFGPFTPRVLNAGFIIALILAGLCLILAGWYMLTFQSTTSYAVNTVVEQTVKHADVIHDPEAERYKYETLRLSLSIHMYIARILLLSCGILVGLAFGFLGFSLFLIGVKGTVDATLSSNEKYKLQVARLSPGLFVILCSAILTGVCATRTLPVSLSQKGDNGNSFELPKLEVPKDSAFEKRDTSMPQ